MEKVLNLGELCDAIARKDEDIGQAEAKVAELRAEVWSLKERLDDAMTAAGTEIARGQLATISKSRIKQPRVVSWERFYQYLRRNNGYHLLQRRLAVEAVREEVANRQGRELPGTETFEQVRLNVKRIS